MRTPLLLTVSGQGQAEANASRAHDVGMAWDVLTAMAKEVVQETGDPLDVLACLC